MIPDTVSSECDIDQDTNKDVTKRSLIVGLRHKQGDNTFSDGLKITKYIIIIKQI